MSARNSKMLKDKYNLSKAHLAKMYKEMLLRNAKKSNISVNEATLSSQPTEPTLLNKPNSSSEVCS